MGTKGSRAAAAATIAFVLTIGTILASVTSLPSTGRGWNYAVLSLSEGEEDRAVVNTLSSAGIEGVVSESTQWVYVDDFSDLERVPLDRYRNRVETFDPRDDGYADRLRSLFVSEGRRRLFIPDASPSRIKVVAALFQGKDFDLTSPPRPAVGAADLVIFAFAILAALFLSGSPLSIAAAIPVLASLASFGPEGFAVASLVAASLRAAIDPAREAFRAGRSVRKGRDYPWLFDGLSAAALFGSLALIGSLVAKIPLIVALTAIAASEAAVIAVVAVQEYRREERGHARFTPVNLARRYNGTIGASRAALPFALASIVSFVIAASLPLWGVSAKPSAPALPPTAVTLEEYRSHIDFQRSFSISRLGSSSTGAYGRYSLESDGLVSAGSERDYSVDNDKLDLPPVERMLSRTAPGSGTTVPRDSSMVGTILVLAAALAAAGPAVTHALRARGRARNIESFADKRIAA